jgi:hypothetical protein
MFSTKRITTTLAGAMMALVSVLPAEAMVVAPAKTTEASQAQEIQYRYRHRNGYYNGHRGYRDYRRGYRRHRDGFWYPLAAFGAGAIIGGAIQRQVAPPARGYGRRHVQWCLDRYRSYRPADNTFVVRSGVRAECRSPYSG